MAFAELVDGRIELTVKLVEGELAASLPGSKYDGTVWRMDLSWPAAVQLRGVFGPTLEVGEALNEALWQMRQTKIDPLLQLRVSQDCALEGPTAEKLYPPQRAGTAFMYLAERCIQGDKPGSGKTLQTIAAIKLAAAVHGDAAVFPVLIVAPGKVLRSWRKHLKEMTDWPFAQLGNTAAKRRKSLDPMLEGAEDAPKVVLVNWEGVAPVSRLERFGNITLSEKDKTPKALNEIQWGTVVADEAHRIADRKAKQTRAIKAVAFGTPSVGTGPARFRFALTGTAVVNNAADIWSLLNFVDPVAWPAYSKFVDRYAETRWNHWGSLEIGGVRAEHAEEFYKALDPYFVSRPREIILPWLPDEPEPEVYTVQMPPKQAKAYKEMVKEMLAGVEDDGVLVATSPLVQATRLEQLAQSYGSMVDKGRRDEQTGAVLEDFLPGLPSCKVDAMLEILEDNEGIPLVFFMESRQLLELCATALDKKKIAYSQLVGGQTEEESEAEEANFEAGLTRVALCLYGVAAEGINSLVSAPTLIRLQKSWSMVKNTQAKDRIIRDGQKAEKLRVIDVVTEGTVEEWRMVRIGEKEATLEQVVRSEATLKEMLTWES